MTRMTVLHVLVLTSVTQAAVGSPIKEFDFDLDGVLPSTDPEIIFFNNSSFDESELYVVQDGLLKQQTLDSDGNSSYLYTGTDLDSSMTTTMEARLAISRIEGSGGVYFQAFDGQSRYAAFFDKAGFSIKTNLGQVHLPLDVSGPTSYELTSPGGCDALHIYVNDSYVATVRALPALENGFGFGDGLTKSGNGGDADWDYLWVSQSVPSDMDIDGDGVSDSADNCVTIANPDQRDTNSDGFGNLCDPDLDNDGSNVNFADLLLLKEALFSTPGNSQWNADADFNGDDRVNFVDLQTLKDFFFGTPGPSCMAPL